MTKLIHLEITDCQKCPWCRYDPYWPDLVDAGWYCHEPVTALEYSYRLLVSELDVEEFDHFIPIPEWCPLSDGRPEKYFVIKHQLEEVTDDLAVDRISVDRVNIGDEQWILNSFEKQEGYVLGDELLVGENVVVVVRGRVVTESEVDLKRGGTNQEEKIL